MTNRLAQETSPYLIQHKDNPVDWYPWGDEALSRARAENKPILLSVGYAACHWCHVMAHESFEDEAIAALMNELYVNIKVDREERPDLDSIYQTALALTGQQGGWPLTIFLRPDGRPFFGGTYFPNERRYGRPAFQDVLREISRIYHEEPERVEKAQTAIMERLQTVMNQSEPGELSIPALDAIAAQIVKTVDPHSGGFGEAPKFPNTPMLELLWRAYLRTGEENYRSAVELSLTHMCQGGIYDHLGGGFSRYSVDAQWLTPHFEKMLYDNAQLVSLLTLVWQSTKSPLFKARVEETVDWVLREMRHPEGGFYSSLDADSEGEEGKFYVWSRDEIESVLGTDEFVCFCSVYGVIDEGNFDGKTILNRLGALELGDKAYETRLKAAREELLSARAHRVRPGLDDKILADWNGLMIKALTQAASAFGRPDWLDAARTAFAFTDQNLNNSKALLHAWREGPGRHPGLAEDYANLIAAAIALFEATAEPGYLDRADSLAEALQDGFAAQGNGYYQTPASAGDVIVRSQIIWDNAVPPANTTMLTNHARLAALTGAVDHASAANGIAQVFAGAALRQPSGAAGFLNAAELLMAPVTIGLAGEAPKGALAQAAIASGDPNRILAFIPDDADYPSNHPLAGKTAIDGKPTAYVCRGQVCSAPVTTAEELSALLAAK